MKLEEHVKQTILEYPTLFKDVDYARSRMKVLNQIFITYGNGYALAMTTDPAQGGYLLEPKFERVSEEWERQVDPPYGQEKYKGPEIDQKYFDTPIYSENPTYSALFKGGKKPTKEELKFLDECGVLERTEECSLYPFEVSQICQYSFFWEMTDKNSTLKPDWLQGAVDVTKLALETFSNPKKCVECFEYPSPKTLFREAHSVLRYLKKSEEEYRNIRELWGYREGQTVLQKECQGWVEYQEKTMCALVKFLNQFDVHPSPPEPPVYGIVYAKALEDLLAEEKKDPKIVKYIIEGKLP